MRPHDPHHLGDTAELPVVDPGSELRGSRRVGLGRTVGLFAALALLTAAFVIVAFLPDLLTGNDETTVEPTGEDDRDGSTDTTDDGDEAGLADTAPTPVVTELADEAVRSWQVTGVRDGLNVRAEPGVDGELLGTLAPDEVVQGTGARADVDGREWKQIRFRDGRGWVASAFLGDVSDDRDAPADDGVDRVDVDDVECYRGRAVNASVTLVADFTDGEVRGALRSESPDTGVAISTFRGTRLDAVAFEVTRTAERIAPWVETWEFGDGTVSSSSGWTIDETGCSGLGGLLEHLAAEIPQPG